MNISSTSFRTIPAAFVLLLSACVDNGYDLSNVDGTIGVNVKELVVPMNLDTITLDAVLDLKENSRIKQVGDEYAVVEDGTFKSEPIEIASFRAADPSIDPIEDRISLTLPEEMMKDMTLPDIKGSHTLLSSYEISHEPTTVDICAEDVSDDVVSIDAIGVDEKQLKMVITLSFGSLGAITKEMEVEGLLFHFIPGLDATTNIGHYDKATGNVRIPQARTTNHKLSFSMNVRRIAKEAGFVYRNHTLSFRNECSVREGKIAIYAEDLKDSFFNPDGSLSTPALRRTLPSEVPFTLTSIVQNIVATSFSGEVRHNITGIRIDPIEMSDIPEVLNQTGTDIVLANPQLYLKCNNPVNAYNLTATADLALTTREGSASRRHELDEGEKIHADHADNEYCLSPVDPCDYYQGIVTDGEDIHDAHFSDGTRHVGFSSLSKVLSGEKIPDRIEVDLLPEIKTQRVTDLPLGTSLGRVEGVYVFFAPLELTNEAKVHYTDTIDGWNDKDVDALVITRLTLNAELTTDLPLDLELTVWPIDKEGRRMPKGDGTYVYGSQTVQAGESGTPIEILIEGEIKHLDGILLEAHAKGQETESLKPEQSIKLRKLRAKVSGTYEREL